MCRLFEFLLYMYSNSSGGGTRAKKQRQFLRKKKILYCMQRNGRAHKKKNARLLQGGKTVAEKMNKEYAARTFYLGLTLLQLWY